MRSESMSQIFTDIYLTLIGFVIFFVFFIGMVFFVYSKSRKKHYEAMGRLPLDDSSPGELLNSENTSYINSTVKPKTEPIATQNKDEKNEQG